MTKLVEIYIVTLDFGSDACQTKMQLYGSTPKCSNIRILFHVLPSYYLDYCTALVANVCVTKYVIVFAYVWVCVRV